MIHLPSGAVAQYAIDAAECDISDLYAHQAAGRLGNAVDAANLSFYRDMIPMLEELLADWRAHNKAIEARAPS
jgi:hypothetical protein